MKKALKVAASTPYALTGEFFSKSPVSIGMVEREFLAGNIYINRGITRGVVGRHPFSGFKMSGL